MATEGRTMMVEDHLRLDLVVETRCLLKSRQTRQLWDHVGRRRLGAAKREQFDSQYVGYVLWHTPLDIIRASGDRR
jgi:hypothetical protein